MITLKTIIFILPLTLALGACSNKSMQFEGENLDKPAYDGTLARVSIYGITDGYESTDGDVLAELQATAKQKLQENRNLFSGSKNNLYTLKIDTSVAEGGIECKDSKLSHITEGNLATEFTLATLGRHPRTLFDVDITTKGYNEVSQMSDIRHAINCGTTTAIATDAISRSIRIFDLLVKQANGLDTARDLEKVNNDKDVQGSAIVMKVISGSLFTVLTPIVFTAQTVADTDWGNVVSAAAKAADSMPTNSYDPLDTTSTLPTRSVSYSPTGQSYAPEPVPSPRSPTSKPTPSRAQSQPAPKAAKPVSKPMTAEIQTRGTTDMHFSYDQALNLATTNADTQARQECRVNYRGTIITLGDPNMAKKECKENHNEEYRCVVQITHTCKYKQ